MREASTHTNVAAAARPSRVDARGVVVALLAASLTAAALGSADLAAWADALPDGPGVAQLQEATRTWNHIIDRGGLSNAARLLHDAARKAEALRFSQQP